MPQDLELYLKSYPHPEYGNYLNFVKKYADTIFLSPNMEEPADGMKLLNYHDNLLYPQGGSILLLNMQCFNKAPTSYAATLFSAVIIVHEAGHKQFMQFIISKQVPENLYNNTASEERHALITGIELFEIILQKPLPDNVKQYLTSQYRHDLSQLREKNRRLMLPAENRERFPSSALYNLLQGGSNE